MAIRYVIDTSAIIDAVDYYPSQLFEQFWELLSGMTRDGELILIDRVIKEIEAGSDDLKTDFINKVNIEDSEKKEYLDSLSLIMRDIDPTARSGWRTWVNKADPWVVAVAYHIKTSTFDHPVVIHSEVERGRKLKIGTECRRLGIDNGRIHRIIREKKLRFTLG